MILSQRPDCIRESQVAYIFSTPVPRANDFRRLERMYANAR